MEVVVVELLNCSRQEGDRATRAGSNRNGSSPCSRDKVLPLGKARIRRPQSDLSKTSLFRLLLGQLQFPAPNRNRDRNLSLGFQSKTRRLGSRLRLRLRGKEELNFRVQIAISTAFTEVCTIRKPGRPSYSSKPMKKAACRCRQAARGGLRDPCKSVAARRGQCDRKSPCSSDVGFIVAVGPFSQGVPA